MHSTRQTAHSPIRSVLIGASVVLAFGLSNAPASAFAEPAASHPGFSHALKAPPAFTPQAAGVEDAPGCTEEASNRTQPMACFAGGRQNTTRTASIKKGYLDNPDTVEIPGLGADTLAKPVSDEDETENDWHVEVEFRESAVVEPTGNATRNESKGALIKGNIRF